MLLLFCSDFMCNGTSHTTTSWGFYPGLNIYFICERCPWSHRIFWYTTTPCTWNPVLQMRSTLETYYTLNHSVFLILFSCLFTKALISYFSVPWEASTFIHFLHNWREFGTSLNPLSSLLWITAIKHPIQDLMHWLF